MKKLVFWIWSRCLGWLQRRCPHDSRWVKADILEGGADIAVSWCPACGAHKLSTAQWSNEWREPRPEWERP